MEKNIKTSQIMGDMVKILLIYPSGKEIYENSKVKGSVPNYFPVNLLTIATPLIEKGHKVRLLDLNFYEDLEDALVKALDEFSPDYVGITFTTPLYSQSLKIVLIIKKYKTDITIVAGGAHITSDCKNTMKNSKIDIAVIGEGDFKLLEIIESKDIGIIKGIAYRKGSQIVINEREAHLKNLDQVPFPATDLIKVEDYKVPHTYCKQNPVFPLETSRGCIFGCVYCNKLFGRTFRIKSTKRVIEDLKKIVDLGYREVHILDDGFTTDMDHAKEICNLIIKENIKLNIHCTSGIRADRVDLELLGLMKEAGFYRVSFGVESGSQKILDNINKGLKKEDIVKAFDLCKKVGIETLAYFMVGLPGETKADLKKTIEFAKKLKPDFVKIGIMIPFPSTPIYKEWKKKGYILSSDWDKYGFHKAERIYKHPNLPWEIICNFESRFYRSFYLSPNFIMRRFTKSLRNGNLIEDLKTFLNIKW